MMRWLDLRTFVLSGIGLIAVGAMALVAVRANAGGEGPEATIRLAQQGDELTAPQAEVLDDGTVSREEYEQAVRQTIACLRDAGISTTEPEWQGNNLQFAYGGYSSRGDLEPADQAYADCYAEYQAKVDRAWHAQFRPAERPDAATGEAYYAVMQECTGSAEATFESVVAAADATGDPRLLEKCIIEASTAIGMLPE
jgi:hypothetical protein